MATFYCSAKASDRTVGATVILPTPIDQSDVKYEVALVYAAFVPSWNTFPDLELVCNDGETKESILFDHINYTNLDVIMNELSKALLAKYGANMSKANVKLELKPSGWVLRLRPNCEVELSPNLSELLGIKGNIKNTGDKTKDIALYPNAPIYAIDADLYTITCDECKSSYFPTERSSERCLEFIHAPDAHHLKPIQCVPTVRTYLPLSDDILLHKLHIKLISNGDTIQTESPDFFVVLHIRPNNG